MAVSQKDIKLLWGRSGNRCSICKTELTQDSSAVGSEFTLGQMAHIVGEKTDAPRGSSILSPDERNSYHNLILLCPTDHTIIDKNEVDWPIEKLHQVKSEHELWVRETLSTTEDLQAQASKLVVTHIIDATVEACELLNWKNWTSWALSSIPYWDADFPAQLFEHLQKVRAAIWPSELEELKNASLTLAILLHRAAEEFRKHCEREGDRLRVVPFYKAYGFNENYDRDVKLYEAWLDQCYYWVTEATKAANWFADTVRKDINPLFFVENGKFGLLQSPFEDLRYYYTVPEFSEDEKQKLPSTLYEKL